MSFPAHHLFEDTPENLDFDDPRLQPTQPHFNEDDYPDWGTQGEHYLDEFGEPIFSNEDEAFNYYFGQQTPGDGFDSTLLEATNTVSVSGNTYPADSSGNLVNQFVGIGGSLDGIPIHPNHQLSPGMQAVGPITSTVISSVTGLQQGLVSGMQSVATGLVNWMAMFALSSHGHPTKLSKAIMHAAVLQATRKVVSGAFNMWSAPTSRKKPPLEIPFATGIKRMRSHSGGVHIQSAVKRKRRKRRKKR